jgi:crotonobetainyl-CoA:carnitine CoA-transferase CaiB-like acyl-CoA transferase
MSGISGLTGYASGPPMRLGVAFPDAAAGISAALACLAALEARRRLGIGQHIEVAQREAAITFIGEFLSRAGAGQEDPPRIGNRDPEFAPQGVYPCRGEDSWIAITVRDDTEWRSLQTALGLPDRTDLSDLQWRRTHAREIDRWISAWTLLHTPREAMVELQRVGVPAGAVLTNADLLADPHLAAREFFVTVKHPDTGALPYIGFPFKLSRTPPCVRMPGPSLGEHNHEILSGVAGLSDREIAELGEAGVIGDRPRGFS